MPNIERIEELVGIIEVGIVDGPSCPPGHELVMRIGGSVGPVGIYQLFRRFEGKKVRITLTVLEDGPEPPRGPRTVRDIGESRR